MALDTAASKGAVIRRRLVGGTLANSAGQFVTLGTGFFLTPFLLHQLGAAQYGLWALIGSVIAYGGLLDLGIWGAVIKYVPELVARGKYRQLQHFIATALRLYTVLGAIAVAVSIPLGLLFPVLFNVPSGSRTTASWVVIIMGIALGLSIPCSLPVAVLRGLQRYDLANLIGAVGTLLTAGATVVTLLLGGGLLGMVAVNIPVMLGMQVPSLLLVRRAAPNLRLGWSGASRELTRTISSYSWRLLALQVAGRLQTETDEIVIGLFLPVSAIAPYAIARRLSSLAQLLTNQFMKVLVPLASQLQAEDDHARVRELYLTGSRLSLAIFLPLGCAVMILARPLLAVWVGGTYVDSAHLVVILTVASLIDISQWSAGAVLQGTSKHGPLAAMSVCAAVANLALSLVLVRRFGVTGVALGTLLPTTVVCLGCIFPYALRALGINPMTALKTIFLPALAPAVPLTLTLFALRELLHPSSWFAIAFIAASGAVVYAAAYLAISPGSAECQLCRKAAARTIATVMSRS